MSPKSSVVSFDTFLVVPNFFHQVFKLELSFWFPRTLGKSSYSLKDFLELNLVPTVKFIPTDVSEQNYKFYILGANKNGLE